MLPLYSNGNFPNIFTIVLLFKYVSKLFFLVKPKLLKYSIISAF